MSGEFWIMKITPGGSGDTKKYFENLFVKEGCKNLIGYTKEDGKIEEFSDRWKRMKIGDLIVVIEGLNRVYGVVEITSDSSDSSKTDTQSDWFFHRRNAKLIKYFNPYITTNSRTNQDTIIEYSGDGAIDICDEIWELIKDDYYEIKKRDKIESELNLLNYKKQIILQGPPGTGKTRMAKEIAKELTKATAIKSPLEKIQEYFKENISPTPEIILKRNEFESYLNDFQNNFKKEELINLPIEKYAFGNGNNDSFCWWIEYGLYDLGGYTGQAGKFKLFWKKDLESYSKIGFIKDVEDDNKAMQLIAEQLDNIVNERHLIEASEKLSNSFILKILHSYFPKKYFPINNEKCIDNGLRIFGKELTNKNVFEKNLELQKSFEEICKKYKADITNIEFMRFLFESFDMKGKIQIENGVLVSKGEYKIIQFHPAYSYEDFVRGINVEMNANSQPEYKVTNRILANFAQKALDNPSANYVLIIDEINRANLPSVLGELIYALEYRYDFKNVEETTVESIYAIKDNKEDEQGNNKLQLPPNLLIIGTMNTADRSVGHIDYAIRRRFAFVDVLPTKEAINQVVPEKDNLRNKAAKLFDNVAELFSEEYLSSDFKAEQVQLGHSYFLCDTIEKLDLKLEFEIKPLLKEYLKDGIFKTIEKDGKNEVESKINQLNYNA